MGVLPAYVSGHRVCAWCLCGCQKLNQGPLEVFLAAEPAFQCLKCLLKVYIS